MPQADSPASGTTTLTADRFFAGFLASVRLLGDVHPSGTLRVRGSRNALNRAFHRAVVGPAGAFAEPRLLGVDWDPLYGVCPWFERALSRARRDLLVGFPDSPPDGVEIRLTADQAERLLDLTGRRDELLALAESFGREAAQP